MWNSKARVQRWDLLPEKRGRRLASWKIIKLTFLTFVSDMKTCAAALWGCVYLLASLVKIYVFTCKINSILNYFAFQVSFSSAAYELENSCKYVGMITETSHSSFLVKQSSTKCFWFICLISQHVWVWMFLWVLKNSSLKNSLHLWLLCDRL